VLEGSCKLLPPKTGRLIYWCSSIYYTVPALFPFAYLPKKHVKKWKGQGNTIPAMVLLKGHIQFGRRKRVDWNHRYLMTRLSLQVFYLWRNVSWTAPPLILWWSNLEILFGPLHRSSPFIEELRCHIAERTQKAGYIVRCVWLKCAAVPVLHIVLAPFPFAYLQKHFTIEKDRAILYLPWCFWRVMYNLTAQKGKTEMRLFLC
jgi:hypothetical protein